MEDNPCGQECDVSWPNPSCNSSAIGSGLPLNPPVSAKDKVCAEIQDIMRVYREE